MTQLVRSPHDPLVRHSKRQISDSQFAEGGLAGYLLGITGRDQGVYLTEATSKVFGRDRRWKTETVYITTRLVPESDLHPDYQTTFAPPKGESFDEITETFESEERLAEYIYKLAEEQGPWKALAERGWELVEEYDLQELDPEAL